MKLFFTFLITICTAGFSYGQEYNDPVSYMNAVSNAHMVMNKKYMAYMSAAAHSSRKRKIEKLRQQTIESISDALNLTNDLPYYKGDNSLRKSSLDYIKICYSVFNDDYARIVNMEDIAEQSYDEMQAYILLQEKTDEKLNEASENLNVAEKAFAAKYGVTLVQGSDEFSNKLETTGKLTKYRNKIYLTFFKCSWQDEEITKALNEGKVAVLEQQRTTLIRYADEGLSSLDTIKGFEGDAALVQACKTSLKYYKSLAQNDLPRQIDFFLKKENFERIKKAYDSKGNPTQQDVNAYNAAVNEYNTASKMYNQVIASVNSSRNEMFNNWNETQKTFVDAHTPYYR